MTVHEDDHPYVANLNQANDAMKGGQVEVLHVCMDNVQTELATKNALEDGL
jgi:hypothetical protein